MEVEAFIHRVGMLYPDFYPVLKNYYSNMYQHWRKEPMPLDSDQISQKLAQVVT